MRMVVPEAENIIQHLNNIYEEEELVKEVTRFRQWATKTLKEYITKGFVINDDMMKNGRAFGKDYFDELLERIREIRTSERRAYQKIADVFGQCS